MAGAGGAHASAWMAGAEYADASARFAAAGMYSVATIDSTTLAAGIRANAADFFGKYFSASASTLLGDCDSARMKSSARAACEAASVGARVASAPTAPNASVAGASVISAPVAGAENTLARSPAPPSKKSAAPRAASARVRSSPACSQLLVCRRVPHSSGRMRAWCALRLAAAAANAMRTSLRSGGLPLGEPVVVGAADAHEVDDGAALRAGDGELDEDRAVELAPADGGVPVGLALLGRAEVVLQRGEGAAEQVDGADNQLGDALIMRGDVGGDGDVGRAGHRRQYDHRD